MAGTMRLSFGSVTGNARPIRPRQRKAPPTVVGGALRLQGSAGDDGLQLGHRETGRGLGLHVVERPAGAV